MQLIPSSRDVKLTHEKLGSVTIKDKDYKTPKWESIAEAVTAAGSEQALLDFIASAAQDICKRNNRTAFAQAKVPDTFANDEEKAKFAKDLADKLLLANENFTPSEKAATKTEKASNFDVLAAAYARGAGPEEIMKLLAEMK